MEVENNPHNYCASFGRSGNGQPSPRMLPPKWGGFRFFLDNKICHGMSLWAKKMGHHKCVIPFHDRERENYATFILKVLLLLFYWCGYCFDWLRYKRGHYVTSNRSFASAKQHIVFIPIRARCHRADVPLDYHRLLSPPVATSDSAWSRSIEAKKASARFFRLFHAQKKQILELFSFPGKHSLMFHGGAKKRYLPFFYFFFVFG